jgi:hypothetical protein
VIEIRWARTPWVAWLLRQHRTGWGSSASLPTSQSVTSSRIDPPGRRVSTPTPHSIAHKSNTHVGGWACCHVEGKALPWESKRAHQHPRHHPAHLPRFAHSAVRNTSSSRYLVEAVLSRRCHALSDTRCGVMELGSWRVACRLTHTPPLHNMQPTCLTLDTQSHPRVRNRSLALSRVNIPRAKTRERASTNAHACVSAKQDKSVHTHMHTVAHKRTQHTTHKRLTCPPSAAAARSIQPRCQ